MLDLYRYPVMLTAEDIENYLHAAVSVRDRELLDDVHSIVYDYLIYPTFNADVKNRIIEKYRAELEKPLKRALLAQYKYLCANGGNLAEWNGLAGGGMSTDSKEAQDILTKVLAPQVINILLGASVNILYAGG